MDTQFAEAAQEEMVSKAEIVSKDIADGGVKIIQDVKGFVQQYKLEVSLVAGGLIIMYLMK